MEVRHSVSARTGLLLPSKDFGRPANLGATSTLHGVSRTTRREGEIRRGRLNAGSFCDGSWPVLQGRIGEFVPSAPGVPNNAQG